MGIREEVSVSPNVFGGYAFYDQGGERFLFNHRGEDVMDLHQLLTDMTEEQRWAYAKVRERLTK